MALIKAALALLSLASTLTLTTALPQPQSPNTLTHHLKRGTCQPGSRTINNKLYTVTCNVDRPGGDFYALQTSTFESCISACASYDAQCVSATFHESTGYCYLKNTLTYESLSAGEDTITLGTGCQPRNDRTLYGRTCSTECGVDHHGGDLSKQRTGSLEGCVQACAQDTMCASAQYRDSTGWCYLKKETTSSVTSDPDVDSVYCGPAPTTPNAVSAKEQPPQCPYQSDAYVGYKTCTFNTFCDSGFINQYNPLIASSYQDLAGCMQSLALNAKYGEAVAFEYIPGYCKIFGSGRGLQPGYQVPRQGAVSGYFNKGSCDVSP